MTDQNWNGWWARACSVASRNLRGRSCIRAVMVTDQDMPKMSGVELLMRIKTTGMTLPVIMATGTLPRLEFALYPWIQPAKMLLKPYTFDELLVMVKNVLSTTAEDCHEIAPPPNWQSQPSAVGLRSLRA